MKYLVGIFAVAMVIFAAAPSASAALSTSPFPGTVAYYLTGPHAIVGETPIHYGKDVVVRKGQEDTFVQWFCGTAEGQALHCTHSFWQVARTPGQCPNGWVLVPEASPAWGDYLKPNSDYCVFSDNLSTAKVSVIRLRR